MLTSQSKYHICLECDKEFVNEYQIAVCPECLEREKEKLKRGIASKYETVNMYLNSHKNQ
jgi:Zn finger protein HypA/HybF involved in hydrogenase expression